jgi:hypothetical protein
MVAMTPGAVRSGGAAWTDIDKASSAVRQIAMNTAREQNGVFIMIAGIVSGNIQESSHYSVTLRRMETLVQG